MQSLLLGRRRLSMGLLFLLPLVAGCAPGKGKVSGQVLYNGKPLPGGDVTFRPANPQHNPVVVALDEQGNYEAVLPVGAVKVRIENRHLRPRPSLGERPALKLPISAEARKAIASAPPQKPAPRNEENSSQKSHGQYVPIPERYHDIETSRLEFTVEGGNQKHDISLNNAP
ncbi:MAG TPA: hypothetical protein VH643_20475 [Gemmataceae bacterium]|jgi:hypothetical protein